MWVVVSSAKETEGDGEGEGDGEENMDLRVLKSPTSAFQGHPHSKRESIESRMTTLIVHPYNADQATRRT